MSDENEKSDRPDISVCDGKYTFREPIGDWRIHVLRHRDPWLIIEKGHRAIAALMAEHREALEESAAHKVLIGKLGRIMLHDVSDAGEIVEKLDQVTQYCKQLKAQVIKLGGKP